MNELLNITNVEELTKENQIQVSGGSEFSDAIVYWFNYALGVNVKVHEHFAETAPWVGQAFK